MGLTLWPVPGRRFPSRQRCPAAASAGESWGLSGLSEIHLQTLFGWVWRSPEPNLLLYWNVFPPDLPGMQTQSRRAQRYVRELLPLGGHILLARGNYPEEKSFTVPPDYSSQVQFLSAKHRLNAAGDTNWVLLQPEKREKMWHKALQRNHGRWKCNSYKWYTWRSCGRNDSQKDMSEGRDAHSSLKKVRPIALGLQQCGGSYHDLNKSGLTSYWHCVTKVKGITIWLR